MDMVIQIANVYPMILDGRSEDPSSMSVFKDSIALTDPEERAGLRADGTVSIPC